QDGVEIGSWSSIPINAGYKVILYLPIGGKAQVKGSYSLEEPTKQITARDVVDKKTLKAFVEAAKEYAKNFPLSEDIEAEFRQEGGRWKHESIYLVIGNSDGVILFHAANPALEGQNVFHLEDPNGVKYTQELIAASAAGGGFVEYYFDNPTIDENGDGELVGDPIGSPKISYAIPFIDSVTGMELTMLSGFYPVTARAVVDKETLKSFVGAAKEYAKSFPFSEEIAEEFRQEGGRWKHESIYLAVLNSEGVIVYHAADADLEGQNLINFEDPNGVKYVQELIAAAAAGGGFVEYYFDNPAVDENGDGELTGDPIGSPKISYAIPIIDSQTGMALTLLSGFYPQVQDG
ncbi:MAG: cache domain-containing protein, partial [Gemmatimonadetes bacterium]|nr:cache domain-containing protein [Gemmatimonadota bacterium]